MPLLTYQQVLDKLGVTSDANFDPRGENRISLLLGNGFSIACDPCFRYESLYKEAESEFSNNVKSVFDRLGTSNFEGVLRLLDDGDWLAGQYDLKTEFNQHVIQQDLESVKTGLINAIGKTHPADKFKILDEKKSACVEFFKPYHSIFTTNYDLLPYWVTMHEFGTNGLHFKDCFRQGGSAGSELDYVVFVDQLEYDQGLFFLHGALHLYVVDGEVRKRRRTDSRQEPLITCIKEGLNRGEYPLFVAEGSHKRKLEQIRRSGYLSNCLRRLELANGVLITCGMSFGDTDKHIIDVLEKSRTIQNVYVGLYGDPENQANHLTKANLANVRSRVTYFDVSTCNIWGEPNPS